MKNSTLFIALIFFYNIIQGQDISGSWKGSLGTSGTEIPLIFQIKDVDSMYISTFDSPNQKAFNIKVDKTIFRDSVLQMVVKSSGIVYEGNFKAEGVIDGTFKQNGINFPLKLSRNNIKDYKMENIKRPQKPQEPFPYHSEDVTFKNEIDSITLSGTLSIPEGGEKFPAIILISGSGPQNRNSEAFGHEPFLVLSDYLVRNGIAVLRFDDRGVGKSQGNFKEATTKNFSDDVRSAVDFLKLRKKIDRKSIGLLGHSEGGIIAPMVAENSKDIRFIILLAGQGLRGDRNLLLQKKIFEQKHGLDEIVVNQGQNLFWGAYDIIRELDGEELQPTLEEYFEEEIDGDLSEGQIDQLVQQLTTPWNKYYLIHDPSEVLKNISIPVLALFGGMDFQVPPIENSKVLENSLRRAGNNEYEIKILDNLNHFFQESETGLTMEYSQIEQTISPKVLEIITEWVHEISEVANNGQN